MGDVDNGKACAILSYLLVGIIWYFADDKMRKNNFAKFHAKQGLNMLIIGVILSVVLNILMFALSFLWFVVQIIWLAWLVLWIIGIVNAATGKLKPVPVIGGFADKYLKF